NKGVRTPERESDEAYHDCLPRWRNLVRTRSHVKTAVPIQPLLASRVMVPYSQHTSISGNVVVRPFPSHASKLRQQHLTARPASPSLIRTRSLHPIERNRSGKPKRQLHICLWRILLQESVQLLEVRQDRAPLQLAADATSPTASTP